MRTEGLVRDRSVPAKEKDREKRVSNNAKEKREKLSRCGLKVTNGGKGRRDGRGAGQAALASFVSLTPEGDPPGTRRCCFAALDEADQTSERVKLCSGQADQGIS